MRADHLPAAEGTRAEDPLVDPFADLLFALVAAVLPVIMVLLPAIHLAIGGTSAPDRSPAVEIEGRPAWTIVAQPRGLLLPSEDGRVVPLDGILDDVALRSNLTGLKRDGRPLLLIVEPDGIESAFTIEPLLAAFGPERIDQVRSTTSCAEAATDALARACAVSRPGNEASPR